MIPIFLLVALLVYLFYKGNQNTKKFIINEVYLDQEREDKEYLKVLQITDMHLENISVSAEELYQSLRSKDIDLIALTGDFLDRSWTIPKLSSYLEVFNKLSPKYGIYAVLGNHDYVLKKHNLSKLKDLLTNNGCKVMLNENLQLMIDNKVLNIIGIDDYSTNRSDIKKSYKDIGSGYNLVLTHDPNIVLDMEDYHYDYLLSGHFHGGQICYPKAYHLVKMGKLPRMNMIKGLHYYHNKPFYISEGLGQTGINIRFGSKPEITLHYLSI